MCWLTKTTCAAYRFPTLSRMFDSWKCACLFSPLRAFINVVPYALALTPLFFLLLFYDLLLISEVSLPWGWEVFPNLPLLALSSCYIYNIPRLPLSSDELDIIQQQIISGTQIALRKLLLKASLLEYGKNVPFCLSTMGDICDDVCEELCFFW